MGKRKDRLLRIRMSSEDYAKIEGMSAACNMTLSCWARLILMDVDRGRVGWVQQPKKEVVPDVVPSLRPLAPEQLKQSNPVKYVRELTYCRELAPSLHPSKVLKTEVRKVGCPRCSGWQAQVKKFCTQCKGTGEIEEVVMPEWWARAE